MSRRSLSIGVGVLLVLAVSVAQAQRRERGDEREAREAPDAAAVGEADAGAIPGAAATANPLMQVLDIDGDGTLSKKEIGAAAKSLRKLDANRDGKLTPDELQPAEAAGMNMGGNAVPGFGAPGAADGAAGNAADGAANGAAGNAGFGAAGNTFGGAGGFARPGSGLPLQSNQLMGFDKNRDGRVTRDELPPQMQVLLNRLDLDRNGSLDVRELRAAAGRGGR